MKFTAWVVEGKRRGKSGKTGVGGGTAECVDEEGEKSRTMDFTCQVCSINGQGDCSTMVEKY